MVFQYGAMVFFCLVETKRGGVISLLPDNLSEIGVEYVEVAIYICFVLLWYILLLEVWLRLCVVYM